MVALLLLPCSLQQNEKKKGNNKVVVTFFAETKLNAKKQVMTTELLLPFLLQ